MSERTLTVAEAAEQLGTTQKAIRRRIERGVLASLIGPDGKRRIPATELGISSSNGNGASAGASAPRGAPRVVPRTTENLLAPSELIERIERLARENGALRQIEAVAGQDREALIQSRARVLELEAQLAARIARRRWWLR